MSENERLLTQEELEKVLVEVEREAYSKAQDTKTRIATLKEVGEWLESHYSITLSWGLAYYTVMVAILKP